MDQEKKAVIEHYDQRLKLLTEKHKKIIEKLKQDNAKKKATDQEKFYQMQSENNE
jgi:hypothetical protein